MPNKPPKESKELTGTPKKIVIFLIVGILTALFIVLGSYAVAWLNTQDFIIFFFGYIALGAMTSLILVLIIKAFQEE